MNAVQINNIIFFNTLISNYISVIIFDYYIDLSISDQMEKLKLFVIEICNNIRSKVIGMKYPHIFIIILVLKQLYNYY